MMQAATIAVVRAIVGVPGIAVIVGGLGAGVKGSTPLSLVALSSCVSRVRFVC